MEQACNESTRCHTGATLVGSTGSGSGPTARPGGAQREKLRLGRASDILSPAADLSQVGCGSVFSIEP